MFHIAFDFGILAPHLVITVFQVRQIDVNNAIEQTQNFDRIISVGIVDYRQTQAVLGSKQQRFGKLWREVCWRYPVDVVATVLLKFEEDFRESFKRDLILMLFFESLTYLVILAVDTAQIT